MLGLSTAALTVLASTPVDIHIDRTAEKEHPSLCPVAYAHSDRHERRRLGYGSTVAIVGAPQGSITVQGWPRNEVEITADIELHG